MSAAQKDSSDCSTSHRSSESLGSCSVSTDGTSSSPSSSKEEWAKRDFLMMPPEEKLKHAESRAEASEKDLEYDDCIKNLVRVVALTRLVHGDRHVKLAQAHGKLAEAYFQLKGWGPQAQEHADIAKELLSSYSFTLTSKEEKLVVLKCLLSVHLTKGGASLLTENEAETSFKGAEKVLLELHGVFSQKEWMQHQLKISSGLCRIYRKQKRPGEALNQCEKTLKLLKTCEMPEKVCSVYRDMATIEQDRGHMNRAIEHLSKAHAIAVSHSPEGLEGARISHSLALILTASAEPKHNDSAGRYFEHCLSAYRKSEGPQDATFLMAEDDYCRFLLGTGQKTKCLEIQRGSLESKRAAFGELSMEVSDTLQVIGSLEVTDNKLFQAHKTMLECLEIQRLLYGTQHKKTKITQKAVDILAILPEVMEKHKTRAKRKINPDLFLGRIQW